MVVQRIPQWLVLAASPPTLTGLRRAPHARHYVQTLATMAPWRSSGAGRTSGPHSPASYNVLMRQGPVSRALSVSSYKQAVAETVDIESIMVEDSYRGPRWEEGELNMEFMDHLLQWYSEGKLLHNKYAYKIILKTKEILQSLPTLVNLTIAESGRLTVCGDVHGQFFDLHHIFALNGLPSPENPYLFNGDFVDRGQNSVEVILSLFGFKLLYPQHFHLARGNHETEQMNHVYGFYEEVERKHSRRMAGVFTEAFNWLPLAHLIDSRVLVVHGGLFSRDGVSLEEIGAIDRNRQPPREGLMCDLLWSDPSPVPGRLPSPRGAGVQFGPDVTEDFCAQNGLDMVIRSHQFKEEGYDVQHSGKCITIFSAPNYCKIQNKGAFISLTKDLKPKFTTFN